MYIHMFLNKVQIWHRAIYELNLYTKKVFKIHK